MKKPWIITLGLACLMGVTLTLWRRPLVGAENTVPCQPAGKYTNCIHDAILHISTNVNITPAAPTGAPYHSIVCVGDTITASGSHLLISNAVQQIVQTYSGTGPCPPDISFESLAPASVTLGWRIDDENDTTNGVGSSISFTRTNGTGGFVSFGFHQITMPTNSECGADVPEGHETAGKTFAFVEVASLAPDDGSAMEIDDGDNNPNTRTFELCGGSQVFIPVLAAPAPELPDAFLPACWTLTGSSEVVISNRTTAIITNTGTHSVTATAGSSTKTTTVKVYRVSVVPGFTNALINKCQDPNKTVTFSLTNSHVPGGVVWALAPSGIADGATLNANGNSATVTIGDVERDYTVMAISLVNTNCLDSATLSVTRDCVCTNHIISGTPLVAPGLSTNSPVCNLINNFTYGSSTNKCGEILSLICSGFVQLEWNGGTIGHCPYDPSNWWVKYWTCTCGDVIMKTEFEVVHTGNPPGGPGYGKGKIETWECAAGHDVWCFEYVNGIRVSRPCTDQDNILNN